MNVFNKQPNSSSSIIKPELIVSPPNIDIAGVKKELLDEVSALRDKTITDLTKLKTEIMDEVNGLLGNIKLYPRYQSIIYSDDRGYNTGKLIVPNWTKDNPYSEPVEFPADGWCVMTAHVQAQNGRWASYSQVNFQINNRTVAVGNQATDGGKSAGDSQFQGFVKKGWTYRWGSGTVPNATYNRVQLWLFACTT